MNNYLQIINSLEQRLQSKKNELKSKQDWINSMAKNEINSSCYERNTVSDLFVCNELKSEIKELEYVLTLLKFTN